MPDHGLQGTALVAGGPEIKRVGIIRLPRGPRGQVGTHTRLCRRRSGLTLESRDQITARCKAGARAGIHHRSQHMCVGFRPAPQLGVTVERLATSLPAIVVSAGPAGLATAAGLKRRGIDATILEAGSGVGTSWRSHYRRLHLHTVKEHSSLPGLPFADDIPRYPSRTGSDRLPRGIRCPFRHRTSHGRAWYGALR